MYARRKDQDIIQGASVSAVVFEGPIAREELNGVVLNSVIVNVTGELMTGQGFDLSLVFPTQLLREIFEKLSTL